MNTPILARKNAQKGFVRTFLLVVVILIVLGYFGLNLRQIVSRPTVQDNLTYAKDTSLTIWNSALKVPVTYVWNNMMALVGKAIEKQMSPSPTMTQTP